MHADRIAGQRGFLVMLALLCAGCGCRAPMNPPRLILLPGLAADARVFAPQLAVFDNLEVPPWPAFRKNESLADFARRMAGTLDTSEPFIIGGVSMGGMIALEIARHTRPQCVILIGSSRDGDSVPRYFRWFEALARPIPDRILGAGRAIAPLISRQFNNVTPEQEKLVAEMIKSTPIDFIRWGARAIFEWPGAGELDCPVYHIHGDADRLIPSANVKPDRLIEGGGHLISITHPEQVNAFIAEYMKPQMNADERR